MTVQITDLVKHAAIFAAISMLTSSAFAGFSLIDFEDRATAPDSSFNTVSFDDGRVGTTINVNSGGSFGIADLSNASGAISFGSRSLVPSESAGPLVFNFSKPVRDFSLQAGDFGDDNDSLILRAFSGANGTGQMLGEVQFMLPPVDQEFTFRTLQLGGVGSIGSVSFIGGANNNSVFVDNVSVQPIPLPPAMIAAIPAVLIGSYVHRRSRQLASR